MKKYITLIAFVIFNGSKFTGYGNAIEIEQDVYGEQVLLDESAADEYQSEEDTSTNLEQVVVAIDSKFSEPLHIYYQSEDEDPMELGVIDALGRFSINTHPGHEFFMTLGTAEEPVQYTIIIQSGVLYYVIAPTTLASPELNVSKRNEIDPAVQYLDEGQSTSAAVRFRSMSSRLLDLWSKYQSGETTFDCTLKTGEETTYNSYEGLQYFYTPHEDNATILGEFTATNEQVVYLLLDPEFPGPSELFDIAEKERLFGDDYKNRTGLEWRAYFGPDGPRPPPSLYMWPAEETGQVHRVVSQHGFWVCEGFTADCQDNTPVTLELEVISTQPRAFVIRNFLSDYEADKIIELGTPILNPSRIGQEDAGGAMLSDTRTSKNAWVNRRASWVTETVTLRTADLLQIHESLLHNEIACEELQVLNYQIDQKYDPHHDWAVDGVPQSRYITILFYLSDQAHPEAGGETAFPKGAGGRGIKVHPGKGSAVLFYNLLPDGNGDDLSLHESRSVTEGEKWLANYWVWDPNR